MSNLKTYFKKSVSMKRKKTGVAITAVFFDIISFQTHESSPPCGNKGKTESS